MAQVLRALRWIGIGLASVVAACVAAVLLALYTAYGRDRVRDVVVRVASRHLTGTLYLGGLRFTPGCRVSLDSTAMRDPDDSLLVATGPLDAGCSLADLVHGRLVFQELAVDRPRLVLRELPSGQLNWSRVFRPDTTPKTTERRRQPALVLGRVRVRDGTVLVSRRVKSSTRPNTAAGRRSSAGTRRPPPRRDSIAVAEWTRLQVGLADLRAGAPEAAVELRLTRLEAAGTSPPITVRGAEGTLRIARDTATFSFDRLALAHSTARAAGFVSWHDSPGPRFDVRVDADTVDLPEFAWIDSRLPREGGGRARVRLRTAPENPRVIEYAVTDLDAHTGASRIRGGLAVAVSPSAVLLRRAAIDLSPLGLDLVRALYGKPLPYGVRGDVSGRVVARGDDVAGRFRIDTLDLRFRDARLPGAVSRVRASGLVDASTSARIRFAGLRVASDGVEMRSVTRLFPTLPRLTGRLSFAATLDSAAGDLRVSDARLAYVEGRAEPLVVTGGGRVALAGRVPRLDGRVRLAPLSFAALGGAYPAVRSWASARGEVAARGTLDDLALRAALAGAGGSLAYDGRLDLAAPSLASRGRWSVRRLDLRAASGDRALPSSDLSLDLATDVRGASPSALAGTVELRLNEGRVDELKVLPSTTRLRLSSDRVTIDTAQLRTSLATVAARGAVGLARGRRDTLTIALAADSLGRLLALARRWDANPDTGAARADTAVAVHGAATARVQLVGSVDSLAAAGEAQMTGLVLPPLAVARGRVTFDVGLLPGLRSGRMEVALDSARAGGVLLSRLAASARAEHAGEWRIALRADASRGGVAAGAGVVALSPAATVIRVDSFALRRDARVARLTRPAAVRMDSSGAVAADTFEVRSGGGAALRLAGTLRDSAVDATVRAARLPLDLVAILRDDTARAGDAAGDASLDAHVVGPLRAPRATLRTVLRAAPRQPRGHTAFIDSVQLAGDYADGAAKVGAQVVGAGRVLARADADVPVRLSLAPAGATLLDAPLRGRLAIDSVALKDVGAYVDAFPATSGTLRARVELSGTGRRPRFTGELAVRDGEFDQRALGNRLYDVQVQLALLGDSIELRRASARARRESEGSASLSGAVGLAEPSNPHFDLRMQAKRMPISAMERHAELDVSADLRLAGPANGASLGGSVTIDRGVVRIPQLASSRNVAGDEDSAFVRLVDSLTNRGGRATESDGLARRFSDHLAVKDLELRLGNDVWLRSAEANINIGGRLRLAHAPGHGGRDSAALGVLGELGVQRGSYTLDLGVIQRNFELERGTLRFLGGTELDPQLDLSALNVQQADPSQGRTQDVRIRARIRGTLQSPTLTLESAGSGTVLTQEEMVSYLVTGQPTFQVGSGEAYKSLAQQELSSRVANQFAGRLSGGGLFDMVRITPGATEEDATGGLGEQTLDALKRSRFGVGKRLNDRTYITVDAGGCALTSSETSLSESLGIGLDYKFTRDVSVSVTSEPPTTATLCSGALAHGFALAPRQLGFDAIRRWRF